jgi:hypothetical protein
MSGRQLVGIPCREPMPNRLFADVLFGHGRDELVVHQQAVHVESLVTRRIGGLELYGLAAHCVFHAGLQRSLEQFRFVFEVFHALPIKKLQPR